MNHGKKYHGIMACCPICNANIPAKLVLKTTDVLLFPGGPAEVCPSCNGKLIPTTKSAVACAIAFLGVGAAGFVAFHFARIDGFVPSFFAGLAIGLLISFGGLWATAKLLRFRTIEMRPLTSDSR